MSKAKIPNKIPYKKLDILKYEDGEFLNNFSLRSRNALASAEIFDSIELQNFIENGKLFSISGLGVRGLKEVITWAWKNRNMIQR